MEVDDKIKMKKDTIEIEGGRNLYNYTFTIEDDEVEGRTEAKEPTGNLQKDESEAIG